MRLSIMSVSENTQKPIGSRAVSNDVKGKPPGITMTPTIAQSGGCRSVFTVVMAVEAYEIWSGIRKVRVVLIFISDRSV